MTTPPETTPWPYVATPKMVAFTQAFRAFVNAIHITEHPSLDPGAKKDIQAAALIAKSATGAPWDELPTEIKQLVVLARISKGSVSFDEARRIYKGTIPSVNCWKRALVRTLETAAHKGGVLDASQTENILASTGIHDLWSPALKDAEQMGREWVERGIRNVDGFSRGPQAKGGKGYLHTTPTTPTGSRKR